MKGIILAGGAGTRLHPITKGTSKQLLHVYDKPIIYYSLSVLLLAKIRDILLISTPEHIELYRTLLGDGSDIGVKLSYKIQEKPEGLAQAFILGEEFLDGQSVCLILGDNLFWGDGLGQRLERAKDDLNGAVIFGYKVEDPTSYGVIEFDEKNNVVGLEEKPVKPKSKYAVTGLYFYSNDVVNLAKSLKPSSRGELEITDINKLYLKSGKLSVQIIGRGNAWLDTGTCKSLLEASVFVESIQKRQGFLIACIEEISWRNGWITTEDLQRLGNQMIKSDYGKYIISLNEFNSREN